MDKVQRKGKFETKQNSEIFMLIQSDILIIGSGIAGLSAALKLAKASLNVTLITKKEAMEANTRYAQGGIASVMSGTDNFEAHIHDTLEAGAGLCNLSAVTKIVSDGPRLVGELIHLGVEFSKKENKQFDLGREGGHSERRILHAGDTTGNELERALLHQVKNNPHVKIFEYHAAIDLIPSLKFAKNASHNRCLGAYVQDIHQGTVHTFLAPVTILATGGAGKAYLYTSNPDIATGDGLAMAYRAGAGISNLEFVQFHPTCLYNPQAFVPRVARDDGTKGRGNEKISAQGGTFLISEAVRGEGGLLKLTDGTCFMEKYHQLKDLAPRDIVARAIDFEMKKRGDNFVFLDISHLNSDFIKKRFPNIYKTCLEFGFDITRSPIPVVPAAHYFCGGISTDLEGRSDLEALYAIGECACTGLHGANRLASNSLLEAVAMADYASSSIIKNWSQFKNISFSAPPWNSGGATDSNDVVVLSHNWDEIRRVLWNYVGIVRSNKRLERALRRIQLLQEEIHDYYWNFVMTKDLIELRNLATVAELIIRQALARKESRGLHYNVDYPETIEAQKKDTLLFKT